MSLDIDIPTPETPERHARGFKGYSQAFANQIFANPQRIASSVGLIVVCLCIIVWNLSRLSILDELGHLEVQEYQLDDQLNDLEFRLAAIDLDRITAEIEAESDRIFQGFPELASWAESLNRLAMSSDLTFSYTVADPHISPVPNVLEVPLLLTFKRSKATNTQAFVSITHLIELILRDHWHIDVLSTQAQGNGDGLNSLNINAQVWVRDRFGFIDLAKLEAGRTQPSNNDPDF